MNNLPTWIVPVVRLVTNSSAGDWCKLQYPGHPKGCPNYNKSAKCPPQAPSIEEYFDITNPLYLVHSEFDLSKHQNKMQDAHPKWSERQCRCVLYWQSTSRKQLKGRVAKALDLLNLNGVAFIPEAMGVNVYATAALSNLHLEKIKGLKICRHIALIGILNT